MLVIISLMTGLVVLSMPGEPEPGERDALALADALRTASRSALIDGATRSVSVSDTDWAVRRFGETGWQEVASGAVSGRVEIAVDGAPVELSREAQPLLIFEPTGQATAFDLLLDARRDTDWRITGDAVGRIELVPAP